MALSSDQKRAFRVAYELLERYYPPKQDEEYWKELAKDLALLGNQHRDDYLARILLITVYEYLEEELRRERKAK